MLRDVVVRSNLVASVAFVDVMEPVTILHHIRLRRLWGLYTIARLRRGRAADDADAGVCVSPHARALLADNHVPRGKVMLRDVVVRSNLVAGVAFEDVVKFVAVGDHARLSGLRCRYTIAGRLSGRGAGSSGGASNNTNASIGIGPETCTLFADVRVPHRKVVL